MRPIIVFFIAAISLAAQCPTGPAFPSAIATDTNLTVAGNNLTSTLKVAMLVDDSVAVVNQASVGGVSWAVHMMVSVGNEIMAVTSVNGLVLGVARGCEGTTAAAHPVSATIANQQTAYAGSTSAKNEIKAIEQTLGVNLGNVFPVDLSSAQKVMGLLPLSNLNATLQGGGTKVQMAGTNSGAAGAILCNDGSGKSTTSGCAAAAPTGTQTQYLRLKPNSGNSTTQEFANIPDRNSADYNFPAITPTGSPNLIIGSNTITLPVAPLGLDAPKAKTIYTANSGAAGIGIYISGGTGAAEAALISDGTCTPLATACTITFTAAAAHSGAYTISSATSGVQEAVTDLVGSNAGVYTPTIGSPAGGVVRVPAGVFPIYASVYVAGIITLRGAGMRETNLQRQGSSGGIIDMNASNSVIEDLSLTATAQQVSGWGIRLGNLAESNFVKIQRIFCEPLYDCILGVRANQFEVTDSIFYNFSHTAITAADAACPDCHGPWIAHNTMFNYLVSTSALACLYSTSSGAISFIDNKCLGADYSQIQYGVYNSNNPSTGYLITANKFETLDKGGVFLEGTYFDVTITGNIFSQANVLTANYWSGVQGVNGTGTGTKHVTISGNEFRGPGLDGGGAAIPSFAVNVHGGATNWMIGTNSIADVQNGVWTDGTGSVTVGPQNMIRTQTAMNGGSSTALYNFSAVVTYTGINPLPPNAANGSALYCSDCNSTCTAGGSTGKTAFKENGAWTCGASGGAATTDLTQVSYYNFTPITPVGSPTITAGSRSLTIPLAPPGFDAADMANNANSVYLSGGAAAFTAAITGATNASPVVYTVASTASLATGNFVSVSGVTGNLGANTVGLITVLSGTTFSVTGSVGSAAYTAGGTVTMGPEPAVVTGGSCTAGGVNCTITVTVANTHSGAYKVSSASAGIQECVTAHPSGGTCHLAAGTYDVYARIHSYTAFKLSGDSMELSIVKAHGGIGIFDLDTSGHVFEDLQFTATSLQTSAAYAIRLGAAFDAYFTQINRVTCQLMYNCFESRGGTQWWVTNSRMYNWYHDAIIADGTGAATGTSDGVGPRIDNNIFFEHSIGGHVADACVKVLATGAITFTNNFCAGNSDGVIYLRNGFYVTSNASTGLMIANNDFQAIYDSPINISGTWDSVTITGNVIDQPGYITGGWGILIANGAGVGVLQGTMTGNMIQGPGGANTFVGIDLEGAAGNWTITGTSFRNMNIGYYLNSSGTVTLGAANALSVTTLINKPGSGALLNFGQQTQQYITLANGSNDNIARTSGALWLEQNPTGLTTGAYSITGFAAGNDGDILTLVLADSTHVCTIKHNVTSSAGNKIISTTGADVVLSAAQHVLTFRYGNMTGSGSFWILTGVI